MSKIASLIFFFFSSTLCCLAQDNDEKEVVKQIEALRFLMIHPDRVKLHDLAAEQLNYGHSSGMIEDRAAFIDEFVLGRSIFVTILLSEQTIKITGDLAIVRHHLTGDTNNKNTPAKIDIRVLMVWQRQHGQWKLLARQAFKPPV